MNAASGVQRGIDFPTRETLLESFTSGYSLLNPTGSDNSEYRLRINGDREILGLMES